MKTRSLILAAALAAVLPAAAGDSQTIDLGNGTTLEISKDGKVSVRTTAKQEGSGSTSAKTSTSSRTDASGSTITSVVSERNGQRITREVTVTKDGKVTVSDSRPDKPADAGAPPAAGGWLGVHTIPVSDVLRSQLDLPDGQGIVVEFVASGGPAATAGILANDILLKLNGQPITAVEAFREALRKLPPGASAVIECLRRGKPVTASATLGSRPADTPPGDAVTSEAERLLREMQAHGASGARRRIVIEENGNTRIVEEGDGAGDAFDLLLNDPNVPETIKEQVRKTREQFRKAGTPEDR
jgi:membrane-associated protease RseP (regulator of RpoE activity)